MCEAEAEAVGAGIPLEATGGRSPAGDANWVRDPIRLPRLPANDCRELAGGENYKRTIRRCFKRIWDGENSNSETPQVKKRKNQMIILN